MVNLKMFQNIMDVGRCLVIGFDLSDVKSIYNRHMGFVANSNFVELNKNTKLFLLDKTGIVIENRVGDWIEIYGYGVVSDKGPNK